MRVFAYATEGYAEATRRAAGVTPVTSPPVSCNTFDPNLLVGNDVLFFMLHGVPNCPVWYGEAGETIGGIPVRITALKARQIKGLDLAGTIVFAGNCFMGNDNDPFRQAFFEAGVAAIVAGEGVNYTDAETASYGASLLGKWFLHYLALNGNPKMALLLSKLKVLLSTLLITSDKIKRANQDALGFELYYPVTEAE